MLNIENLKAGYSEKVIIDIPEFSLASGENCLIIGKSGSGKTTLLYAIAGLLTPISGNISIAGTEITHLNGAEKDKFRGKTIGIIYQTLHMVSALTVLENIFLVQYSSGVPQDKEKAEDLLNKLGITELKDKKPSELSQGQQQRVAIARAAINNPKIILGDEPTSALDDDSCEAVMKLLLDVAKTSGASLVIATHDHRIKKYFTKNITLGGANE